MPKHITKTVYEFDELSDEAKKKAREWYRDGALDYEWWDCVYEDANRIGLKITGFDLGGKKQINGRLTQTVQACCEAIMKDHGETCGTYKLAAAWIQESAALTAAIESACDDEAEDERERMEAEQEENKQEFERALLEEYFSILDQEFDYLNSDEQVDESIRANEYTFTKDGKREG